MIYVVAVDRECAARRPWRIDNMFKCASAHHGIDTLARHERRVAELIVPRQPVPNWPLIYQGDGCAGAGRAAGGACAPSSPGRLAWCGSVT
jgi:hypothetical protein